MTRILIAASFVAILVSVGCSGGSPSSPSGTGGATSAGGATITGTVIAAGIPTTNVSVAGTPIASAVDTSGSFRLGGVPTGDVQLVFSGSGSGSAPSVSLSNVMDQETIDLRVAIAGGTATVQSEVRGNGAGKIVICHREGNGSYHPIDVSVNAEPAHRGHGDATPGEPVPADPTKVFDAACALISPVDIEKFTNGQDADDAPGPTIPVGSQVTWTYVVTNQSALTFTSLTVTDDRGVAVACPRMLPAPGASITCTGSGQAVAGQYRNVATVTVTANGRRYTDSDASHYFGGAPSGVRIEKFTNGQHVSQAPGPAIPVGSTVTWTYVVTNTSLVTFSSLSVTDDRGVVVACPRAVLAPGASITCSGSGTAVAGQYRNIGTVVATANGTRYTDTDASYYVGGDDEEEDGGGGPKVQLCHRTGNGQYHLISVGASAERAHRAHGDGMVGEAVPGNSGRVFTASCGVR